MQICAKFVVTRVMEVPAEGYRLVVLEIQGTPRLDGATAVGSGSVSIFVRDDQAVEVGQLYDVEFRPAQ